MAEEKDPIEPTQEPEPEPAPDPKPEPDEEPKDKHGLPGINRDKYQRDIKERDEKIAELEAQVAAAAETKEGREKLESDIQALRDEMADKDMTHSLEMAGCVNVKAAKAVLADYEGDVSKLQEECPYLFQAKQQEGTTGLRPAAPPSAAEERRKAARAAAGLE